MSLKAKNITAIYLMVLILFSTIGFNIISTFCAGCEIEHTTIALTHDEEKLDCACCTPESEQMSCCSMEDTHSEDHHQTKSKFAQLKFDSREAKSQEFKAEIPVIALQIALVLFQAELIEFQSTFDITDNLPPPLSGRAILTQNCILRV